MTSYDTQGVAVAEALTQEKIHDLAERCAHFVKQVHELHRAADATAGAAQ